jgi:hypothetical protein
LCRYKKCFYRENYRGKQDDIKRKEEKHTSVSREETKKKQEQ